MIFEESFKDSPSTISIASTIPAMNVSGANPRNVVHAQMTAVAARAPVSPAYPLSAQILAPMKTRTAAMTAPITP